MVEQQNAQAEPKPQTKAAEPTSGTIKDGKEEQQPESQGVKQDSLESNYMTNRPTDGTPVAGETKEAVKEARANNQDDTDVVRAETLGVHQIPNQTPHLGLDHDVSHTSSYRNLGEATPAFSHQLSKRIESETEYKKFTPGMGQIPETLETPEESARYNNVYESERTQIQTATFQENKEEKFRTEQSPKGGDAEFHTSRSPRIEIEEDSAIYDSGAEIQISRELLARLLMTGALDETEAGITESQVSASKDMKWTLNKVTSAKYLNGLIFARYLIFLKQHMKHHYNQIWSFKIATIREMKSGLPETVNDFNWKLLNAELDKISINIQENDLNAIISGNQEQVDRIFTRIERYSKIITDSNFLKFQNLQEEDRYADDMDDSELQNIAITEENLSEMFSLRQQNTMRSNISKPSVALTKMITRGLTKNSSKLTPSISKNGPKQSLTMLDNGLRVRTQQSELLQKSQDNADQSHIKVIPDFIQESNSVMSSKPTEVLMTEGPDITEPPISTLSPMSVVPRVQPKEPKKVKDGVDILALDANKVISDCDSSLELILITLSRAFQMNPKQAAALLTNNNQYLITACIRGVKGGRYEPLISWYEFLIDNQGTLATLLTLELEQLPQSAKQTFVKVMAAVGCGFFSYNSELVFMTFNLFSGLFELLKSKDNIQEQAVKWFLSQAPAQETTNEDMTAEQLLSDEKTAQPSQMELVKSGGLRLSLYAITKHREATKHAMQLYDVLCDKDSQMVFTLYTAEIQKNTKSVLEYMQLVGEFLPVMSETGPDTAIDSGLIDFWLDLSSREAENDFKVQNKEKVLAISLLTEIWLYFTDYVDEKEAVTNTLIFVFKRTVSERTKSIRLISIAYLFKVLEKLIERKKKAALTLYRTLIFSLVESPYDPTIRELYLANFSELFKNNAKIPVEWLVEPLLKQMTAQLGVTFVLKVFDFTFMMTLMEHPKFKEEHASLIFALFAQVSQDDTSYASVSHEIMLAAVSRFLRTNATKSTELLDKVKDHIRHLFESLLELEPISKAAAQTQMKRQQRQNALKLRQPLPLQGRTSVLSLSTQNTPGQNKPPLKAKDLLGQGKQVSSMPSLTASIKSNYSKEMQRRLKKSLIITFLLKLQALNVDQINQPFFKELLFEKTSEFKGMYGYFNKGHLELLKLYGDPEQLILDHLLDPQLAESQKQLERDSLGTGGQRNGSVQKSTPYTNLNSKRQQQRNMTPSSQHASSEFMIETVKTKEGVVALMNIRDDVESNTRQVVPFNEGGLNTRNKSIGRTRALQEIEKIKQIKKDRESKKEAELDKQRKASAQRKKLALIEIEKRKKALGVADRAPQKLPSLPQQQDRDERVAQQQNQRTKPLMFVKIEEEEDRDRETVLEFMRKYQKLWRNIFAKYQGTGHAPQVLAQPTFDRKKSQTLTFAEITKLLKDHGAYPQLISKEEVSQMVRLVNQRAEEPRTDISSLTYSGYQSFIIQLAVHIFSKPPQDLSALPMVKSLEALVNSFLEAMKKKNLSTLLYEDPDAVVAMTKQEKELLKSLNEKVKEQPNYPMPDGFLKVKEKVPVIEHKVPASALPIIGEAKAVCVEVVDQLVSQLFDFHVLEPVITISDQFRVKPSMQRSLQKAKPERSDRAEALSIIRRAEERRAVGGNGNGELSSRNINRVSLPKLNTKAKGLTLDDLPPIYKKIVKKAPKAKQGAMEECSFVLENIVRRVLGEPDLEEMHITHSSSLDDKRMSVVDSRELGSNSSKNIPRILSSENQSEEQYNEEQRQKYDLLKQAQARQSLIERRQKEKKRQERQRKLKEDLTKLKEEKALKEEEEAQKRKEDAKKKREAEKKLEERRQKQREELIQEIASKKEEKEAKNTEKLEADAEEEREKERQQKREKREFFKKQQEKMNNQFKSMAEQRKASTQQEQQKALQEKKQKDALKKRIDQEAKQGQGHNERQLAAEILSFLKRAEVAQLFSDHEKSLLKYFKFYCKQNRVELGQHDLQYRLEHCDFGAFNKLGLQSKIVPVLISSEQLKQTFINTLKYQLNNPDLQVVQKQTSEEGKDQAGLSKIATGDSQQMNYEQFKQALVRISIQGQELLGGQSEEQKQRQAQIAEKRRQAEQRKKELLKNRQEQRARLENETLAELRLEFSQKQKQILAAMSKSPSKRLDKVQSDGELMNKGDDAAVAFNEDDFQRWLKQQDAIGNGLNHRVAEKLNNASKPKPAAAEAASDPNVDINAAKPVNNAGEEGSPAKLHNQPEVDGDSVEEAPAGGVDAPLLRAKQSQAQKSSQPEGTPAENELDIAFISSDTVKSLFEFMKVEAGDEGERSVDQVLAAQSSYGRGRGGPGPAIVNPAKRGLSKEPASLSAQEQQ